VTFKVGGMTEQQVKAALEPLVVKVIDVRSRG
jgi:hypothetical protein